MEDLNEIKEIVVTVKDEIIDKMETYAIKGAEANAIENFNINEPPFKGTSDEDVQKMIDEIFGKN